MEIVIINEDDIINTINLNNNVIIFGQNNSCKSKFINNLKNGLLGKNKKIMIDGKMFDLKEFNVICMNEDNDFSNEFKFTKNNVFKQMIYSDIIRKVNEEKIINYTNFIFDVIDKRVNKLLDRKINKNADNNISFNIEVPDINSIIDKFTNIYIDDLLIYNDEISKSMKRKLLYQLYFWEIEKNNDKNNIVLFDNFDAFLGVNEVINLLSTINKLSNENCHFILTTTNNIFEYISLEKFSVYKMTNKLLSFDTIDFTIKKYIIRREYEKESMYKEKSFETFYNENEHLIDNDDILKYKNIILDKYPHLISKILNCTNIKIVKVKPKNITSEYIICENDDIQKLFFEISNDFVD